MKILIVDDKRDDLERTRIATQETFPTAQIFATDDEDQALEWAKENHPDLAVLDIILKKEHGYTMCRKILALDSNTIVILLTGSLNAIDSRLAEQNGASGFAIKTRTLQKFRELLNEIVELSEMGLASSRHR
jgi:DNA-binding response OmpR family regulator